MKTITTHYGQTKHDYFIAVKNYAVKGKAFEMIQDAVDVIRGHILYDTEVEQMEEYLQSRCEMVNVMGGSQYKMHASKLGIGLDYNGMQGIMYCIKAVKDYPPKDVCDIYLLRAPSVVHFKDIDDGREEIKQG